MNKFLLLAFFFTVSISSQESATKDFDSIINMDEAEDYLRANKSKYNKLITFNEENHKTALALDLFKLSKGGATTIKNDSQKIRYKIIEKNTITHYRVSYIYLDGLKMLVSEINALRDKIMLEYKEGIPFSVLAKRHSMDNNAKRGGDLGWFEEGITHPAFESEIKSKDYNVDDVFTVDIVQKQWYYVVLKTHEPKEIKEIKVLKIVEPLN